MLRASGEYRYKYRSGEYRYSSDGKCASLVRCVFRDKMSQSIEYALSHRVGISISIALTL